MNDVRERVARADVRPGLRVAIRQLEKLAQRYDDAGDASYAAVLDKATSPLHRLLDEAEAEAAADAAIAAGVGAGWQELGDWRPKPWVRIDLWIQCYDLADRDSDRLVPTVGKRVPSAVWFDGQWCNGDGNPHEDFEGFEDARITHWRPEPAPPVFPAPPRTGEV